MTAARAAVLALALALAGCGGSGSSRDGFAGTYAPDEVVEAFERRGFTLVERKLQDFPRKGGKLYDVRGAPFVVVVTTTTGEIDAAWRQFLRQGSNPSRLVARRANAGAFGERVTNEQRRRAIEALAALPDRGDDVEVA